MTSHHTYQYILFLLVDAETTGLMKHIGNDVEMQFKRTKFCPK